MRLELAGFSPDLDPETPGILVDCDAIVPTLQGLAAANSLAPTGIAALAATPLSAFTTQLLDGTRRMFAATATKIYEASGTTWTDRSRAGDYSGTNRQRFCVFGNNVLNTNRVQAIGQAAPGGAFADIAGAPAASIIVSVNGFVMAFDTNDGTYGDRPDGWWSSGIRDQTVWAPSAATQAANGRLLDSPGRITAGAALGNDVVAYKDTSMYVGRYVGPPVIWAWQRVSTEVGCAGAEAVVVVDTAHFFVGPTDFYSFDGTVPRPLESPLREWFQHDLNQTYRSNIIGSADRPRGIVYWYYPSTASADGSLDSLVSYNYRTNQWGRQRIAIQTPVVYSSGQITYDGLGGLYATYNDLPEISYDSPFWLQDQNVPGVFQGNSLYSLTGAPGASWMRTGDIGDITRYTFLSRVSPRFTVTPASGTASNYYRNTLGETATQDATSTMSRYRFDFRRSARWHSIRMDFTGNVALNGLDIDLRDGSPE